MTRSNPERKEERHSCGALSLIPTFYHPKISLSAEEWISLSKPAQVMEQVIASGFADVRVPTPMSRDELCRTHDPDFVDDVLACKGQNGFGDCRPDVVEQVLWANGAFVDAAACAIETGVAFAPVSGFHHATYARAGGFCTFNGLIVAANRLLDSGEVNRILILDFDGHYGNGTQDLIEHHELDTQIRHLTRHRGFTSDPIAALNKAVVAIEECPDLVMYQAAADSHIDDFFGAGYFPDDLWKERDRILFNRCRDLGVPLVWNLAGGYSGHATIDLHVSTWSTAATVYCAERAVRAGCIAMNNSATN